MKAVFVSASVPDPMRKPVYFETADNVAIRDAITALVQVVTPRAKLVFGGHPAITPMVARVARTLATLDNVVIFQSAEFAPYFPPENSAFQSLRITDKLASQSLSLDQMREEMIHYATFDAAFFIGGMEGVEDEWAAVHKLKPPPPCYPVASTGAAALRLAREHGREFDEPVLKGLYREYNYFGLFRELLGLAKTDGSEGFGG